MSRTSHTRHQGAPWPAPARPLRAFAARRFGDVDEGDAGVLFSEGRHDGGADAAATAGDENGAPAQTGIGRLQSREPDV